MIGLIGGKAIRLSRQIYADVQVPNYTIQVVFLVVPKLSRPCIIGIDLLDEFKSHIDLDNKIISFSHLEGKPSIRIINEEGITSQKKEKSIVNSIQREDSDTDVKREEITSKIEESNLTDIETKRQLEHILWKHKAVFRKEPGKLKSFQHTLRVKEDRPLLGRSYPIPLAYRERVDEEIKRMLDGEIIQRSSSPYINPIVPVIKKR